MEPWDGPASIAFTDGKQIGAVLDRNGLRPSRYYVTKDDLVIMASEAGVLDIPPRDIVLQGPPAAGPHVPGRHRARPHRRGRGDQAARSPPSGRTAQWLERAPGHLERSAGRAARCRSRITTRCCSGRSRSATRSKTSACCSRRWRSDGVEAVGSMGNDTPLAVLSNKPRLLYDYFKQLFAQVTNPPIDCIREEIITSAETRLGSEGNLLNPQPADCRRLEAEVADPHQRGIRQGAPHGPAGPARRRAADPVPRDARRERPGQVDGRDPPDGAAHDRGRGSERPHPERPRRESTSSRRSRRCSRSPACITT